MAQTDKEELRARAQQLLDAGSADIGELLHTAKRLYIAEEPLLSRKLLRRAREAARACPDGSGRTFRAGVEDSSRASESFTDREVLDVQPLRLDIVTLGQATSLNSWVQVASPVNVGRSTRSRRSSDPCVMIVGAASDIPAPSGVPTAPAERISSATSLSAAAGNPRPNQSIGHDGTAHPEATNRSRHSISDRSGSHCSASQVRMSVEIVVGSTAESIDGRP